MLVLGHGAGAGEGHPWMKAVASGLCERGVTTVTFNFPYMETGRKLPDPGPKLELAFQQVWVAVAEARGSTGWMFAGGKSMGGRISTQAVARELLQPVPAGIVCFGYPLHPPGKPETRRDGHLAAITPPILFLHGTRDPFGTPSEMTELSSRLPTSTLQLVDGGDHSLERSRTQKMSKANALAEPLDRAAEWVFAQCR